MVRTQVQLASVSGWRRGQVLASRAGSNLPTGNDGAASLASFAEGHSGKAGPVQFRSQACVKALTQQSSATESGRRVPPTWPPRCFSAKAWAVRWWRAVSPSLPTQARFLHGVAVSAGSVGPSPPGHRPLCLAVPLGPLGIETDMFCWDQCGLSAALGAGPGPPLTLALACPGCGAAWPRPTGEQSCVHLVDSK